MLKDLKELLEIKSELSSPLKNAPFGENMRLTLDWFLNKASEYGLKTEQYDGYCGYAEYGEAEGLIGILCHLDVVPAGNGWSVEPYTLTQKDGNLYGRGVVDNKGSAIIALHILKSLKQNNVRLNNRIRIIVGCNEENGSACLKHYVKCGEIPKFSFVPDSDFPIINSEKGIMTLDVTIPSDTFIKENIELIDAGERANVVPDYAKAVIKSGSALANKIKALCSSNQEKGIFSDESIAKCIAQFGAKFSDFSLVNSDDKITLEAYGKAGHAMKPHRADNAIHKLIMLLDALKGFKGGENLSLINKLFCNLASSARLGIACSDEKSGELTISLGVIKYSGNDITLTFNFRLPLCADYKDVIKKIEQKLPMGSTTAITQRADNLYIDPSSSLIKTLLSVYEKATGERPYTVQTGGGTYARELPNSVAFGPTFPGMQTNIHDADEHISVERFNKLYEIYFDAVMTLDKI